MAAADDLQFQEFDDATNLLAANPDATTISITDSNDKPKNQRGPSDEVGRDEDEDLLGNEDSDKAELLAGQKKSAPFWTFEYYQTFFDVDTFQVLDRIKGSLLPLPGKNFVRLYIRSNPDLYGPFWICATLVFAIAISGNLANFLTHHGQRGYRYVPEFHKGTLCTFLGNGLAAELTLLKKLKKSLSIAATAIYTYAWLIPLGLWGFLMWRNNKVMNIVSYSFLEIVCVYGYSLFIYIPTAMLWIIPSEIVRWLTIVLAMCLSGTVLVMTFWPAVRDDNQRIAITIIVIILILHALLAVGCKAYFFDPPEKVKPLPLVSTTITPTRNGTHTT